MIYWKKQGFLCRSVLDGAIDYRFGANVVSVIAVGAVLGSFAAARRRV